MVAKSMTGVGLSLGVIGLVLSPQVMDKLEPAQVFYLLLAALVLTSLGTPIIPAFRGKVKPSTENHSSITKD